MDCTVEPLQRVYEYENDEEAARQELELFRTLADSELFHDDGFPANPHCLYFDPLHPPSGGLPVETLTWLRLCKREVFGCTEPQVLADPPTEEGLRVLQRNLANHAFVNALSLLAGNPDYILRIIVSRAVAPRGLFTIKVYLDGRWQYVHIDDRIPCTSAERPAFASCQDRNQTWPMLVEKALAKALGCYEALCRLTLEEAVLALTGGAVLSWQLAQHANSWEYVLNNMRQPDHHIGFVRSKPGATHGIGHGMLFTVKDVAEVPLQAHVPGRSRTVKLLCLETRWQRANCSDVCVKWNWSSLDLKPHGQLLGMRNHSMAPSPPQDARSFVLSEAELLDLFDVAYIFCDSAEWASVSAGAYQGSWIPGHPTKGVGGPPSSPTFSQNPAHPVSISQTSKLAVVLSRLVEEGTEEGDEAVAHSASYHQHQQQQQQQQQHEIPIGWVMVRQDENEESGDNVPGIIVAHCNAYQAVRSVSGAAIVLPGSYLVVPYCDARAASSKYRLDIRVGALAGVSDGVTQLLSPQQSAQELSECGPASSGVDAAAVHTAVNLEPLYEQVADLAALLHILRDSLKS